MRVVVVGGGISGLTAAWAVAAARPDDDVTVLDAAAEVGGKLRFAELAGVTVDVGAEAMLVARPEGVDLLTEAGLAGDRISPLTTSAAVFAGGIRHPLPARTMMGIPGDAAAVRASGALTASAVAAIEREPDLPPLAPLTGDVAVGALVRERLGAEVLDRLVEPILGGVYAGRADELSMQATMAGLSAALRDGGSLVRAVAATADRGTRAPGAGPIFTSLAGGLGRLPQALASAGRFTVRRATTVRAIRRTPDGFVLDCGPVPESEPVAADAVIVALPPAKAARLLRDLAPVAATELAEVETASVAIVSLAFTGVMLPAGSGLLVAAGERVATKGVTVSSQKWPLGDGHTVLLRASLGRAGDAVTLQRDDSELVDLVRRELRPLLGIDAGPIDALVTRWGGGLPQYAVGHTARIARVRAAVATVPGLAVCGAAFDGVGIPACIAAARAAAARVAEHLTAQGHAVDEGQ